MSLPWMPLEDDCLRAGLSRGMSFRQIADEIGATRNMVAGRVKRLGLRGPRFKLSQPDTNTVRPPSGGGHSASPAHFGDR